jgi:hypothetical protein
VAIPVIGTGFAGHRKSTGHVMQELLPLLHLAAFKYGFDVVLVCWDEPAYCAAQMTRLKLSGRPVDFVSGGALSFLDKALRRKQTQPLTINVWPLLTDKQVAQAKELAALAVKGDLSIFFAVPTQSKLDLLRIVSKTLCDFTEQELKELSQLSELDQARYVEAELGGSDALLDAVVAEMNSSKVEFSLYHLLLCKIPCSEIMTTDQSGLYEDCAAVLKRPLHIIPKPKRNGPDKRVGKGMFEHDIFEDENGECLLHNQETWLMNLEGSINAPETLLLTRDNHIKSARRRAVLASVIQALLITKHVLFIGVSLKDSQLCEALEGVLRNTKDTLSSRKKKKMREEKKQSSSDDAPAMPYRCTVLVPHFNRVADLLFAPHVRLISLGLDRIQMDNVPGDTPERKQLQMELHTSMIFIDCIAAQIADSTLHLFDTRFADVLEEGDQKFVQHVTKWLQVDETKNVWQQYPSFINLLRSFGLNLSSIKWWASTGQRKNVLKQIKSTQQLKSTQQEQSNTHARQMRLTLKQVKAKARTERAAEARQNRIEEKKRAAAVTSALATAKHIKDTHTEANREKQAQKKEQGQQPGATTTTAQEPTLEFKNMPPAAMEQPGEA